MSEYQDSHVSRRSFLKGAAVTAVAATATGIGAAQLSRQGAAAPTVIRTAPLAQSAVAAEAPATAAVTLSQPPTEILTQLAAQQAENVRLQAALEAAQQQIAALQEANNSSSSATESLTLELDKANERVGVLAGLVALYDQLDDVDLGALLHNGLDAVSGSLRGLLDEAPGLEDGVLRGAAALDEVEAHIPLLENGRNWLAHQTDKLQRYFAAVDLVLDQAVDRVGSFLEKVRDWFTDIQKWLPFNIGQRALATMDAMTTLLAETEPTISGLTTNVMQPLDVWLGAANEEAPLKRTLLKPMREEVLARTSKAVEKVRQVEAVYQTQLDAPVKTAVDQQRALRDLIAAYRQEHQL